VESAFVSFIKLSTLAKILFSYLKLLLCSSSDISFVTLSRGACGFYFVLDS